MEESTQSVQPLKVVRFTVLLALTGVTIWQIKENASKYMSYEAVTTLSKETADSINFPQVTICNFNRWKMSLLTPYAMAMAYRSYARAAGKNTDYPSLPEVPLDAYNFTYEIGWHLTDQATPNEWNLSNSQTLLKCRYGGQMCNSRFFRHRMTSYGNCYTFNKNLTQSDLESAGDTTLTLPLTQTHASEANGLELHIDVEASEYSEILETNGNSLIGIKVLIHSENEEPDPTVSGFAVSPGFYATMAVKKTEYNAIPPPFGTCDPDKKLKRFQQYSKSACEIECKMDIVDQNCSCTPYFLPKTSRMCDVDNTLVCAKRTIDKINGNFSHYCDCPMPCYYEEYTPVVSYANFPSLVMGKQMVITFGQTPEQIKNSTVGLKIYLAEIGSTTVTQSPSYTPISALNDLGGTLGLYLGFSIFTFFEFAEYVVEQVTNHKAKKKNVSTTPVQPIESVRVRKVAYE